MTKAISFPESAQLLETSSLKFRRLDSRTRFSHYLAKVVRVREPASFWRENVIAVIILLRHLERMSSSDGNKLSAVRSFIILRSGEGLTSFNKNGRANFSGKKVH